MNFLELHKKYKCEKLYDRYITNSDIKPILKELSKTHKVSEIGKSVMNQSIYAIEIGTGKKRILMWSQMHGNESTTTKAIFDLLNTLQNDAFKYILKECSFYIIPILNPDGASSYTRLNANNKDLNRDAQNLSQPESLVLKKAFDSFKPNYCFNLHGQRTIFSAGSTNNPATVSFLSPAQDDVRSITPTRKIAMELIVKMNETMQKFIPNQIGRYDDSFNINCVGDTFQNLNVPTVLFEAGHYKEDYEREKTREYIYVALLTGLDYLASNEVTGNFYNDYLKIPENKKLFFDIIIRNCRLSKDDNSSINDIGILYKEELCNKKVVFVSNVEKISNLKDFYGHKELNANNHVVLTATGKLIEEGLAIDFVLIKNELFALNAIKN